MRTFLIVFASIIPIFGAVPYFISSLRRKIKPRFATWSTWTLINAINAAAAFADGAAPTAIASTAGALTTGVITLVALRNGFTQYSRFDAACQALALLGIPFWLLSNDPAAAVVMVLIVNLLAGLPTLRHVWKSPHEEMPAPFIAAAAGSLLVLASLKQLTFVAVALPLAIVVFDSILVILIFIRRRARHLVKRKKSARVKA